MIITARLTLLFHVLYQCCLNLRMALYLQQISITDSQLGCLWLCKLMPVSIAPTPRCKSRILHSPFLASYDAMA
ncbi:hypothetical protein EDB19DRAFT_1749075 [Suillus lakei]|nr:hypothetical protein EDB19DRAFT_1797408 [Suillus lakei]KAG1727695.1 hypothetical protein EDB19DRAFT_1749075 [Suillus lakei]